MFTFNLPWPPKELTPNFKQNHHWRKYYKQAKAYRTECELKTPILTQQEKANLLLSCGKIPMTITFYPPDNRRRDKDGMIAAFKAGQDGLSDAWRIDDWLFDPTYKFGPAEKNGRVEVSI